jgi:uncharacterized protein (DUF2252 family)
MLATRLLGKAVVVRELMPQDLKFEVGRLSQDEAVDLAAYLAAVVGNAHARQMTVEQRSQWRATLETAKSARLNAPTWLWTCVADLVGVHERAYLEHCRLFALAEAA